jgi:hypothetical protein
VGSIDHPMWWDEEMAAGYCVDNSHATRSH